MEIKNKLLKSQNKRWLIVSFFISTVLLLPLIFLFSNVFNIEKSEFSYLWNTLLLDYSLNTLYLVFLTGSFSLIFGIIPAWFISNYNFRLRKFFDIALYLPLAIPTYIMAFTYSDILSFTGPIQSFLRKKSPNLAELMNKDYLQIEILGIILGLALYPYIYTACRLSFSLIGSSYINMSKNLGLSGQDYFLRLFFLYQNQLFFQDFFLL